MTRAAVLALLALPAAADVVEQPRPPVTVECWTPGADAGRYGPVSPTWWLRPSLPPSVRLSLDNPRIGGPTPLPTVPLPAAGLMLGVAVALVIGLALMRRRG